jgi:hypothetical protein
MTSTKFLYSEDLKQAESAHRASLLINLERRFKIAREKGNAALIRQLEDERDQLAL